MIRAVLFMVSCAPMLLAIAAPTPEVTGTLAGIDGKPVAGITITVESLAGIGEVETTVSKADGSFSFASLTPGGYGVVAKSGTACAYSSAIGVKAGLTAVLHLRLVKDACGQAITF